MSITCSKVHSRVRISLLRNASNQALVVFIIFDSYSLSVLSPISARGKPTNGYSPGFLLDLKAVLRNWIITNLFEIYDYFCASSWQNHKCAGRWRKGRVREIMGKRNLGGPMNDCDRVLAFRLHCPLKAVNDMYEFFRVWTKVRSILLTESSCSTHVREPRMRCPTCQRVVRFLFRICVYLFLS